MRTFGRVLAVALAWHGWAGLASLFTAAAAVGALLYTAHSLAATRSQLGLTEQGQLTDCFSRAVEQLGSDKRPVVLGGIYALERLARDSSYPQDQPTIMEVLAAFIRDRAPITTCSTKPNNRVARATDIQAALTVIGRRDTRKDSPNPINLRQTCLAHADLAHANLTHVDLTGADLTGVIGMP